VRNRAGSLSPSSSESQVSGPALAGGAGAPFAQQRGLAEAGGAEISVRLRDTPSSTCANRRGRGTRCGGSGGERGVWLPATASGHHITEWTLVTGRNDNDNASNSFCPKNPCKQNLPASRAELRAFPQRSRRMRMRRGFSAGPPLRLRAAILLRRFAQGAFTLPERGFGIETSIARQCGKSTGSTRPVVTRISLACARNSVVTSPDRSP